MSKSKKLYIFGYAGHAYVVLDVALANGYEIIGYFDKNRASKNPYAIDYIGDENHVRIDELNSRGYTFPAVGSNIIRKKLVTFIERYHFNQITLIDSSASVSPKSFLGKSTIIAPKTVVNSMVQIGKGCIVNSGSLIEHECKLGDFTHVAPGAVLAGNVTVGNNVFVGANSVIKQGVTIGDNATIGAGAVVLRNIPDGQTWAGNPAKIIS